MKKLAVLACAFILAMGLAACSGGSSSSAASGSASASSASASASGGASASAAASSAAASSAGATSSANLTDFGWISFEMPDGWVDAKESDAYVTINDEANTKHIMKISRKTLLSSAPTAADVAANDIAKNADRYADGGKKTIGDREWTLVTFDWNGNPSAKAYTDLTEKKALEVTLFEITTDDPAAQKVLTTFKVDESKL